MITLLILRQRRNINIAELDSMVGKMLGEVEILKGFDIKVRGLDMENM